jgi:hypothetical protein
MSMIVCNNEPETGLGGDREGQAVVAVVIVAIATAYSTTGCRGVRAVVLTGGLTPALQSLARVTNGQSQRGGGRVDHEQENLSGVLMTAIFLLSRTLCPPTLRNFCDPDAISLYRDELGTSSR